MPQLVAGHAFAGRVLTARLGSFEGRSALRGAAQPGWRKCRRRSSVPVWFCTDQPGARRAQEWITPQPSRRPDTQPEFEKLETPMPRRLPGDPEIPDEEEEEEEEKKKKDPEKDPDKEKPDAPPGEE